MSSNLKHRLQPNTTGSGKALRALGARLRGFGVVCLGLVLALLLGSGSALADSISLRSAHDAPDGLEPSLRLPPVPSDFLTRDIGFLRLSYPASLSHWAGPLLQEAEGFRAELQQRLGRAVLGRVDVRLAVDTDAMKSLAPVGAPYPAYATGVAYSSLGLILLSASTPGNAPDALRETFRHELAHVALHDATEGARVPLWFNEGLAIHLSREDTFARTQALWMAVVAGNLFPLSSIDAGFPRDAVGVPLAYAQSADIVRFLLRREDQQRFVALIKRLQRGQSFDAALTDSYSLDIYGLEQAWRSDVEGRYTIWPIVFGGTAVWTVSMLMVVLAWRRKRQRERVVLGRWEREEAAEDLRRLRALGAHLRLVHSAQIPSEAVQVAVSAAAGKSNPGVKVPDADTGVQDGEDAPLANFPIGTKRDTPVPKVEHDGNWHTLH